MGHIYVETHYSCPWSNTFKKPFKISWTTSCNSNKLEVTLFAINLPISYWYTGLYRVSMLHVPPPGQRGDKNLSSSSSNNKRLEVKVEEKMQTLMKARRTQDHSTVCFFCQNILRWRQLQNNNSSENDSLFYVLYFMYFKLAT